MRVVLFCRSVGKVRVALNAINIAVVDDEDDLRAMLVRSIEALIADGYPVSVTSYADGSEILEALKDKTQFDIIVSDLRMPKMSGIDLLKYLGADQSESAANRIIVFSGYLDSEEMEAFPKVQTIPKPLSGKDFRSAVERKVKLVLMDRRQHAH
jgi:CheY-like chemotaxis protein